MPGIRFVCDSTCDLESDFVSEKGITLVPLSVVFGDEAFRDGVDMDAATFYERMRLSDRNPTTSQPSPASFVDAFRAAGADGSTVICTCMSSAMSGTYGGAVTARESLPELDIRVIDTRTVSVGHYAIVRAAVGAAERTGNVDEVLATIDDVMRRQRAIFTLGSLEYLRRGGRIGGATALLGSVLSIRPVLQILDGRIEQHDRVRTNQRALERMAEELISAVGEAGRGAVCVVGSAVRDEDARRLVDRVAPHCSAPPALIPIGPIVGCHTGPGMLGMSFHIDQRS